jgi:protein tyrosine phosphatase (PTP) superfamily phosphohydrolase (DUF442 family)
VPTLQAIPAFLQISGRLGTAGQPTRAQFAEVKAAGYEAVINLALPTSPGALRDESDVVTGLGMSYHPIPVDFKRPTVTDLQHFFNTMEALHGRRLFVHCAANMRVSAFVFLWRVLKEKTPADVAEEDLLRVWKPDPVWQRFIDHALAGGA